MDGQAANNAAQNNTGAVNGNRLHFNLQLFALEDPPAAPLLGSDPPATPPATPPSPPAGAGDPPATPPAGTPPATDPPDPAKGAPEKYEQFKLPEGAQYNEEAAGKFGEIAKKLNLSQAGAQELVDMYAAEIQSAQQKQYDAWMQQRDQWVDQVKKDPEIGGAKMDQSLAVAKRGLMAFGSPELNQLLVDYGLGDHPAVIKAFYKAGLTVKEDGFTEGRQGNMGKDDIASTFFPNTPKS